MVNILFLNFALKIAARNISIHKVRSALTVMAIVWSVAALVALRTLGVGLKSEISKEISEFLQADIIIAERSVSIPQQVTAQIARIPQVKDNVGAVFIPARVGKYKNLYLVGIPPDKLDFFVLRLRRKVSFSSPASREIIIDLETARAAGIVEPGLSIKVAIKLGSTEIEEDFKVLDVMESRTFLSGLLGTSFAIVPLGTLQELLGREGFINYIFIKLEDRRLIDQVGHALSELYPGADIIKQTDVVRIVTKVTDTVSGMLMALTSIGLLVAALGVMNTVMMSIRERIREVGILKTIGARDYHIIMIFLLEVLLLGTVGGLMGIVFGYFGSFLLRDLINSFGIPFEIPIRPVSESFVLGLSVAISVSVASALYPILRVARIRPMEALRIE